MPVEIRELHIKVNIDNGASPSTQNGGNQSKGAQPNVDEVVSRTVDEVLRIINRKKEK
jgi:hypothetical protein